MDMDVITILKFEEMVALYIKILKKTITDTELELFKYNLEISCCVPNAIFFNLNSEAKKILGKAPLLQMGGNHSLIYYV